MRKGHTEENAKRNSQSNWSFSLPYSQKRYYNQNKFDFKEHFHGY